MLEGGFLKDLLLRRRQETICGEKIACVSIIKVAESSKGGGGVKGGAE